MIAGTSPTVVTAVRATVPRYLRWYHRHEVHIDAEIPEPALIVGNHGFGGLADLNVLAMFAVREKAAFTRPVTALVHQLAWTVGARRVAEVLGGRPASREAADAAFAAGHNVLVFPGGDVDAGKSWRDRNRVQFDARCGFARLAMVHGVPVVPVVTAGAGDSLFVVSDGQHLARRLRLHRHLRVKALPISVSIPWGVSVGVAGILPYVALPTKLITAVLPPMTAHPDESAEDFAARVEAAMQARLNELVANRKPLVG
jgi:1-acyl-sn-glycerol-3-phosphate acyltransferase